MTSTFDKMQTKDGLVKRIAKAFGEEERTEWYLQILQSFEESLIQKAYQEVKKVPIDKIKKSQSALFFYLLKKYAQK